MKLPFRLLLYSCSLVFLFCGRPENWRIYNHKNTGLGTDLIRNIFIENDSLIWVGTYGAGLYRWDNNKTWTSIDTPFAAKYLLSIEPDNNALNGGIVLKPSVPTQYYPAARRRGNSGGIWFGTADNGAFYLHNNRWSHFSAQNGLVDNNVWDILIDRNNAAWLCSRYRGISIISKDTILYMTVKNGLPDNQVTVAAQDSLGRVWIGTARGGLCCCENNGFRYLNTHNSLSGNYIRAIICDTTARWVGSWDGGLDYFNGEKWEHIREVKPPVVFLGFDKNNALWVGTWGHGVFVNRAGNWETISAKNSGLPDDHVIDIDFDDGGRILFATSRGLANYKPF